MCSSIANKKCNPVDLTGMIVGRLTVIDRVFLDKSQLPKWEQYKSHWRCLCLCGNERIVCSQYLIKKETLSCGCHTEERLHRLSGSPEYNSWNTMIHRCTNPKNHKYPDYGGRGIGVCIRWLDKIWGFKNFLSDMGNKPSKKHTIGRKDNEGNYEKDNCRWETTSQQARNKRNNHWIEFNGHRMVLQDWATLFGVNMSSIIQMIKRKKTFIKVYQYYMVDKQNKIIEYKGKKMNITDWAKLFGVHRATLAERIANKQPFEKIYQFYKIKNKM